MSVGCEGALDRAGTLRSGAARDHQVVTSRGPLRARRYLAPPGTPVGGTIAPREARGTSGVPSSRPPLADAPPPRLVPPGSSARAHALRAGDARAAGPERVDSGVGG